MITEYDLREAIAECEGKRNPDANTCVKLAAFYTILNHMYGAKIPETVDTGYSYASEPNIKYSESEFSGIIKEKGINQCFGVIDEIMQTISITNPRLYNSAIRKLNNL